MSNLLKPISLSGGQLLKNRVWMSPMTRNRGIVPTDMTKEYYKQRASAGLIISEGILVTPHGTEWPQVPGLYSDEQVQAWRKVTDVVHEEGGKIYAQLWHVGRLTHPSLQNGEQPISSSETKAEGTPFRIGDKKESYVQARGLSTQEVKSHVLLWKKAAENAKVAGFDGVELHGAHGYMIEQFLRSYTNKRTDIYGGSIENRCRFLFELIDVCAEVFGIEKVGLKLSPLNFLNDMGVDEDQKELYEYISKKLDSKMAYVVYMYPFYNPPNLKLPEIDFKGYRELFKGTIVWNCNINVEQGERYIEEGSCDAVSFGRLYISNPDLPARIEKKAEFADADPKTFYEYEARERGFIDYPALAV